VSLLLLLQCMQQRVITVSVDWVSVAGTQLPSACAGRCDEADCMGTGTGKQERVAVCKSTGDAGTLATSSVILVHPLPCFACCSSCWYAVSFQMI